MASESNETTKDEHRKAPASADIQENVSTAPDSNLDKRYHNERDLSDSDINEHIGFFSKEGDPPSLSVKSPAANFLLSILGQTGCLVLIVFLITSLLALRYFKILPFLAGNQSESPEIRLGCQGICSPNFTFIATYSFSSQSNNNFLNGSALLFYYDQANESIHEVSIDPETAQAKALVRGDSGVIASIDKIVPSPDGQKIGIIASKEKDRTGVYVLNFSRAAFDDFIEQWSLGLPKSYVVDGTTNASWSPDGTALVFSARRESQSDLFLVKSEKEIQRITNLGKNTGSFIWLNDQRLAFVSDWEGKDQIYTIKRDGGDLKKLPR